MLTCPDFQAKTTPWRKGGELFNAYKQKWGNKNKSDQSAQQRSSRPDSGIERALIDTARHSGQLSLDPPYAEHADVGPAEIESLSCSLPLDQWGERGPTVKECGSANLVLWFEISSRKKMSEILSEDTMFKTN